MTCAAIMTPNPHSVRADHTVGRAADELIAHRYINLPVVDEAGRLVGLFGMHDLLALLVPRIAMVGDLVPNLRFMSDDLSVLREKYSAFHDTPVSRAMNKEPIALYADTAIVQAVRLFCHDHMTLPVIEQKTRRLVGIVSYWDVTRAVSSVGKAEHV